METIKVAIQGFEGSFHHIVAQNYFKDLGYEIELRYCSTFSELGLAVENKEVEVAVMAIENSIAGSILQNYKVIQQRGLKVVGEQYLKIDQNLMALKGTKLEDIKQVCSHPMALLQCMEYLEQQRWQLIESEDTALSAKQIAEGNLKGVAAVAGEIAAKLYGLEIIKPQINTIKNNLTRFLIVTNYDEQRFDTPEADKSSLYLKTSHREGALLEVLQVISKYGLNMSLLQSCPMPENPFSYIFHLALEFDNNRSFVSAISELSKVTEQIEIYGVYKRGEK